MSALGRTAIGAAVAAVLALGAASNVYAQVAKSQNENSPIEQVSAPRWRRAELYFGIAPINVRIPAQKNAAAAHAAERRWQSFLDREVTPRFPDGFTVLDGYGQWRPPNAVLPMHEHSRVLVIVFDESPAHRTALEQIRDAWKQLTGDQSVLLVVVPVEAAF